jgi:phage-related tail fiber protein
VEIGWANICKVPSWIESQKVAIRLNNPIKSSSTFDRGQNGTLPIATNKRKADSMKDDRASSKRLTSGLKNDGIT